MFSKLPDYQDDQAV